MEYSASNNVNAFETKQKENDSLIGESFFNIIEWKAKHPALTEGDTNVENPAYLGKNTGGTLDSDTQSQKQRKQQSLMQSGMIGILTIIL